MILFGFCRVCGYRAKFDVTDPLQPLTCPKCYKPTPMSAKDVEWLKKGEKTVG